MFVKDKKSERNETKEGRFKRIASRRVQNILNDLRLLGNCANTSVYGYSEEDIRKIFLTIDTEIKRIKALFSKPNKKEKFRL